MKNKLKRSSSEILNKKFETKINGYDPTEVDEFLDEILSDYLYYEKEFSENKNNFNFKNNIINDKEEEIKVLNAKNKSLLSQIQNQNNNNHNNQDLIMRIAKLEAENIKK